MTYDKNRAADQGMKIKAAAYGATVPHLGNTLTLGNNMDDKNTAAARLGKTLPLGKNMDDKNTAAA